jgi:hypothetical protein
MSNSKIKVDFGNNEITVENESDHSSLKAKNIKQKK